MSTKKDKFSAKDKKYMKIAINLARARRGLTGENPSVGCVIVKNDKSILEKIKDLPFDYYQMYDCSPEEIFKIKEKYNKKIIAALTIENKEDAKKYKDYKDLSEIILFDSKGYEKSMSFNHNLLDEVEDHIEKMIAGCLLYTSPSPRD